MNSKKSKKIKYFKNLKKFKKNNKKTKKLQKKSSKIEKSKKIYGRNKVAYIPFSTPALAYQTYPVILVPPFPSLNKCLVLSVFFFAIVFAFFSVLYLMV